MKRFMAVVVAAAVLGAVAGPTLAAMESPRVSARATEGLDIRAKVEPKGIEGPDIRAKVEPKEAEGPDVR